jgi:hypothetical protein
MQSMKLFVSLGIYCWLGLFGTLLVACSAYRDYHAVRTFSLRPGAHLPSWVTPITTVHKGGTLCSHQATVNGVCFSVDVACGTDRIVYVETSDAHFTSAEGLAVGDELEKALAVPGAETLPDSCDVRLPSQWIASCDRKSPPKIASFYAYSVSWFRGRS